MLKTASYIALWIKRICSTTKDFEYHIGKQDYDQKLVDEQLEKVDKLVRGDIPQEKDQEQQDPKRIPIILTYNWFLPNLTAVARQKLKHPPNQQESTRIIPITAFKRNKNLKEIIRSMENSKVKTFSIPSRTGKCTPCLSGSRTLCCNQVLTTNTFSLTLTVKVNTLFI